MIQSFKQYLKYVALGAFALLQIVSISPVFAYGWDWDIKNFDTTIQINKDSTIDVNEKIVVDFSREQHHGIYRLIPIKYVDTEGKNSQIPIHVSSITDENGKAINYSVSDEDEYLNIKIGDPDVYVNTLITYNISYKAERAIGNYDAYDEIYWNATGDKWEVPIENATATIKMPQKIDAASLKATCYTGSYGSREQNCKSEIIDGATIKYTASAGNNSSTPALSSMQGLSIVGGFPKGIVDPTPPSEEEIFAQAPWYIKIFLFFIYNWGLLIPVGVGILMAYFWYTKGRDPSTGKTAIMPFYTAPDNLKPSEVGTIIDESVDIRDITSAIIDLAIKGYLQINEKKEKTLIFNTTNFSFKLLKPEYTTDPTLEEYEKKILNGVFKGNTERDLNDLNNEFYKCLPDIKKRIYESLVKKGYFPSDPDTIRSTYLVIGSILLFGPLFLMGGLVTFLPWSIIVGIIISGIIITGCAKFMPARTLRGAETRYKILGLEEYIKTAEKDRIKFQEQENIFEKILPYALALGIAEKWTKAFEGIYKTPPNWYRSNDPNFLNNFNTFYFLNSINSLSSGMSTSFQSAPRSSGSGFSSGGGFSGGGGGGGGGGAW
jgi:uncharacterized membrane protein